MTSTVKLPAVVDQSDRIKRWLLAQSLTFAAFEAAGDGAAWRCLDEILAEYGVASLHTLPPAAINMLWRRQGYLARDDRHRLEEVRNELIAAPRNRGDGSSDRTIDSPISKAAIMALVILKGTGDSRRIGRLGYSFFGKSWQRFLDPRVCDESGLSGANQRIRDQNTTSAQRLEAVVDLCRLIDGTACSEQLENALLHHCFSWPLLVRNGTGVALPVLVDAILPDDTQALREDVEILGDTAFNLRSGAVPTFHDWLQRARDAAYRLWRSQYGSAYEHRPFVETFTARVDFTYASRIVGNAMRHSPQDGEVSLEGGSASAYLTQFLLADLLCHRSVGSMVTGEIGERVCDEETGAEMLDYAFGAIDGAPAKLQYVFDCEFADDFVVPPRNEAELVPELDRRNTQTAHVYCGCAKLSTVADIVQGPGWRRTEYVRCPEVGYTVVGWKNAWRRAARENQPFELSRPVRQVLAMLDRSRDRVIEFPSDIWPTRFAQALEYINSEIREFEVTPTGDRVRIQRPAPALSWGFIRMVDGEEDAEFWQSVWRVMGASKASFEEFASSPSARVAAEQLVRALNIFSPTREDRSHRAPDVLAIIGYGPFRERWHHWHNKGRRPLAPAAVLEEIREFQSELRCAPHRSEWRAGTGSIWRSLKNMRIALLSEPGTYQLSEERRQNILAECDETTLDYLKALSVFDCGFTHHNAAPALAECGVRGGQVYAVLRDLDERDLIHRFGAEYFLPDDVKEAVPALHEGLPATQAKRHLAAGRSFAPYAVSGAVPAMSLERALEPASIVAARKHFEKARGYAITQAHTTLRWASAQGLEATLEQMARWKELTRDSGKGRQALERAGLWPGPGLIYHLIQRGTPDAAADAVYFAQELIGARTRRSDGTRSHPTVLLDAAKAFELTQPRQMRLQPDEWRAEVVRRFEHAVRACEDPSAPMTVRDRVLTRVTIQCWFAEFLAKQGGRSGSGIIAGYSADMLDAQVWAAAGDWRPQVDGEATRGVVPGNWFERQADEQADAKDACDIYLLGHVLNEEWHQLRFKGLGAAVCAGITRPALDRWLDECADPFREIAQFAWRCAGDRRRLTRTSHVGNRGAERIRGYWQAAANVLQEVWRTDGFQEALWAALAHQQLVNQNSPWIRIRRPATAWFIKGVSSD